MQKVEIKIENQQQDHTNWYELTAQSVLERLDVTPDSGLSEEQVHKRQESDGKNVLQPPKKTSLFQRIIHQLKDVSIIVLLIAVVLSFLLAFLHDSGFVEPIVILSVVVLNIILAITHEGKAEKALEALEKLSAPYCVVMRDGVKKSIDAAELVSGDIVILETGNVVPADARLVESVGFFSDESALTGESEPAEKDALFVSSGGGVSLGDQHNMVFTGCVVTAGRGVAVVTATGMRSQMGQIAGFLSGSKQLKTPLQIRLDQLGRTICWIAIISAFFLMAVGLRGGADLGSMLLVAISLAVAAVPEMLALIVTLTLTNGVQKMVRKHALIRKLPAVETLGNTSVICSDKTGTLTQNRMAVKQLWVCGGDPFSDDVEFSEEQSRFLMYLAMASNATFETDENGNKAYLGNATDVGILRLLDEKGFGVDGELYRRVAEIPFSSDRKRMSVVFEVKSGGYLVLTKGALDYLPLSSKSVSNDLKLARVVHDGFAEGALRVIGLASKIIDTLPDNGHLEDVERDSGLVGLIGLIDPPRPEVAVAIARARVAGIRTVMITGDHAVTAGAIARSLGILEEGRHVLTGAQLAGMSDVELNDTVRSFSVYARVTPEDKIRIVRAWQAGGEVVAMTGDGVNDAPALKAADIGIAMGKSGTEVAKSASDMVLTDDNFATIVEAVGEGRNVYANIRKTINFLLVCNLSEIIIMVFAQMAGWGILLTPVMLLLINLVGDGIPGINLSREGFDPKLMDNQPIKRNESFFSDELLHLILRQTIACSVTVLIGYYIGAFVTLPGAVAPSPVLGQTMAFLITGLTSIVHVFHVRSSNSVFKTPVKNNMPLVGSAVAMVVVFALLVLLPVGQIFGLSVIGGVHWLIVIALTFLPTLIREVGRYFDNIPLIKAQRHLRKELANKIRNKNGRMQV
ncbi:MAG: cation-translocating P-type ATPase [Nitrososphaerota archaeon]|uniref:cation-translocating P-type ATPase n=1 Tax=Candidatus Bathycorpusculum sp. TaxID=2994959 RepID=UPI002838E406|nr:cation-translocating P-type ATPase [Candidatus Termitimicrobium sp.]MDR0493496.1 cation-translocating P-type ATPase [Nitrososphaerota archaeon]